MAEFHETRMGQQFYDKTMPALVKAIERLAESLELIRKTRPSLNNDTLDSDRE